MATSMGPGPGKQRRIMRKQNKATGDAIAAQKQKRINAYNADPRALRAGKYAEKMARYNPNIELNEYGLYKGTQKATKARKKGGAVLRPKFLSTDPSLGR